MHRREFLRLGGVGCAAMALGSGTPALDLFRRPTARVRYREAWRGPGVDAASLATGDAALARDGVRLTVFGFAPEHESWRGRATLDVLFSRGGWSAPFHAWSHDGRGVGGSARSASFVLPVDDSGRIALDTSWDERAFPVELSSGSEPGLPKLRRGIYTILPAGAFSITGALNSMTVAPPLVAIVDLAESEPRSIAPWRIDHV